MYLKRFTKHLLTALFWLSGFGLVSSQAAGPGIADSGVTFTHANEQTNSHVNGIPMLTDEMINRIPGSHDLAGEFDWGYKVEKDGDDIRSSEVFRDFQRTVRFQRFCLAPRDTLIACEGDTISLLQNFEPPEDCTYQWEQGEDLIFEHDDSLFMNPQWIADQSRTFRVVVGDSLQSDSGFVIVYVIRFPTMDLPDSSLVCQLDSCALIVADPAYTYAWEPMENFIITQDALTYGLCPPASTWYHVNLSDDKCTSTDSIFVEVINPDTTCMIENFALSSQFTYIDDTCHFVIDYNALELSEACMTVPDLTGWVMVIRGDTVARGGGITFTGSFSSDPCNDTIAQVSVTLKNQANCPPFLIRREINIQKSPVIELMSATICKGDTTDYLLKDPGFCYTYQWAPTAGLFFPEPLDSSVVRAFPTSSTTYRVTVSNEQSSLIDSVKVEVRDSVKVTLQIVHVLCDSSASLLATSQNNSEFTPLQWSYNPDFEPSFSVVSGDTFHVISDRDTTDVYLRAVMISDTSLFCGSNIATLQLFDQSFDIVENASPLDTCVSDFGLAGINFAGSGESLDSIQWSPEVPGNLIDSADLRTNPFKFKRLPGQSEIVLHYQTTYTRRCNQSGTLIIPASGNLEVDLEVAGNFCGDTVVVQAISNYPDVNLEWSFDAHFQTVINDSSVDQITLSIDTVLTVYLRATANRCSVVTRRTFRPKAKVELISTAPDRICIGDTAIITISPKEGETFLTTWASNGQILSSTDTSITVMTIEGLDNLEVNYWAQSADCPNVRCDSLISIPFDSPISPDPVYETIPCTYWAQLMADEFYQDQSITWTVLGLGMTFNERAPIIDFGSAGIFNVVLRPGPGLESCRFAPDTLEVMIPEYVQLTAEQDTMQILCPSPPDLSDSLLILSVTSNLPGIPISWMDREGNILGERDSLSIDVRSGLTAVMAIGGPDASGCTDTVNFSLVPYQCVPEVMGNTGPFCANQEITGISARLVCENDSLPEVSYAWASVGAVVENGNTSNPVFMSTADFTVVLSITDLSNNCLLDTVIFVEVEPQPIVNIAAFPGEKILIGQTVTLTGETDGPLPLRYQWSSGETTPTIAVTPPLGLNNFTVTIIDGNDCPGSDLVAIDVQDCLTGIPNAFSPNRDDVNERFRVRSNCPLEDFEMKIINRWGEEVFFTTDQDLGWDGTMNGSALSPDAYAYFIQFRCPNQSRLQTFAGNVSLLR